MTRRTWITVVGTLLVAVVSLLAASSGPVRLWDTPSSEVSSPSGGADPVNTIVPANDLSNNAELPHWLGGLLRILCAMVIAVGVLFALSFAAIGRLPQPRWRERRERTRRKVSALPEIDDTALEIDIESARAALLGGAPRNSIVACWMQLERDAAAADLARMAAETPTEYVERVVALSSVDPAPIGELAALYREARFSRHQIDEEDRTRALAALDRVATGLESQIAVRA